MPHKLKSKIIALNAGRLKTYFVIVMSMAAVLIIYSLIIVIQLKNDTEESNKHISEYFNTAVDNNLNGISDFAYKILRSTSSENMNGSDNLKNAANLRYEVYMYKSSNRLVADIIEYFPAFDMMVGNNGYYSPLVYYKSGGDFGVSITYSQEKFEYWFNCLFSDKQAGFYQINDINGKPALFYFCSLPNPINSDNKREVVVILSTDGLVEILKELVVDGGYVSAMLVDENGTIYAQYGEELGITSNNIFDISSVDKDCTVYETSSLMLGLNCVTIKENGTAYKTVSLVTKILIAADIFAICIGILLSIVYAERNRRELQRIAALFQSTPDEALSLKYLEKQIDALLADNRSVVDEAERQQRIVDTAFFNDIINRKKTAPEEITHVATLYNEDIANDSFVLAAIEYTSEKRIHRSDIYNLISEFEHEDFKIYYAPINNALTFMINFDSDCENGRIEKFLSNTKNTLRGLIDVTGVIVSVPFVSIDDVPVQWEKIRKSMNGFIKDEQQQENTSSEKHASEYVDPGILAHEIAVKEYNNSQLSLQLLAERVGVSQAYLSRVFKQKYGMSVMQYINYLRVEEAKRLITSDNEPLKVIALKVGFISDINFIRVFKKFENVTPGSYRIKEEK